MRSALDNLTCAGCGCACDDVHVTAEGGHVTAIEPPCALGESWFRMGEEDPPPPAALVDGQPASVEDAVAAAADILTAAHMPLVFGMGHSTCEAQREAIALAELIGGV